MAGRTPAQARRRRAGRRGAVATLATVAFVAAWGTGTPSGAAQHRPAPTSDAGLPAAPAPAPVVWMPCPNDPTLQCGSVTVPLDYHHPRRATLRIALTRAPALDPTDPDGTLVFNPGGPGESGNQILPLLLGSFPPSVRRDTDIVSFDPRGTGASEPLDCGTQPAAATSVDPVPAGPGRPLPGTSVFTTMADACHRAAASLTPFVDTTNTARDLDRIRRALGLRTISYYGLSYGTVLGAVYADLFPHHVARMVLDGAVDLDASLARQADEQAPAAERSLEHLFATCAARPRCPLGSDPRRFFLDLAGRLRRHPLPAPGDGDDVPVTVGDLDTASLFAVSVPSGTDVYESAVVAAAHGDGGPLRSAALSFATDIDGSPLVDPLWAITCNDAAGHPGPTAAGRQARTLAARLPLLGGYAVTYAMGGCVAWPRPAQPLVDVHPKGAPPILVVGNTGDPNTPLVGSRHLAASIAGARLVVWDGWGHTWLLSGPSDRCMRRVVGSYLGGGGLPAAGTTCH